jgi:hypothetical protein
MQSEFCPPGFYELHTISLSAPYPHTAARKLLDGLWSGSILRNFLQFIHMFHVRLNCQKKKKSKRILYMKIDIGFYVHHEVNSRNIQQTEKKYVADENETNIFFPIHVSRNSWGFSCNWREWNFMTCNVNIRGNSGGINRANAPELLLHAYIFSIIHEIFI